MILLDLCAFLANGCPMGKETDTHSCWSNDSRIGSWWSNNTKNRESVCNRCDTRNLQSKWECKVFEAQWSWHEWCDSDSIRDFGQTDRTNKSTLEWKRMRSRKSWRRRRVLRHFSKPHVLDPRSIANLEMMCFSKEEG